MTRVAPRLRLALGSTVALAVVLDADVRFRSAADRRAFTEELVDAVLSIVQRYHTADGPGRSFRLIVGAHPSPPKRERS